MSNFVSRFGPVCRISLIFVVTIAALFASDATKSFSLKTKKVIVKDSPTTTTMADRWQSILSNNGNTQTNAEYECDAMTPDSDSMWIKRNNKNYTFRRTTVVGTCDDDNVDGPTNREKAAAMCLHNKSILFIGHCVSRSLTDEFRLLLDKESKPIKNRVAPNYWHLNSTNTIIDFVFLYSESVDAKSLASLNQRPHPYDVVVITSGLWEMIYTDMAPEDTLAALQSTYDAIVSHTGATPLYILLNQHYIWQSGHDGFIPTMRSLCQTEDRQRAYRNLIQCAIRNSFGPLLSRALYLDPFRITYRTTAYPTLFRKKPLDGMHYTHNSPITREIRDAVIRGICRDEITSTSPLKQNIHPREIPFCRPILDFQFDCHLVCRCDVGPFYATSYCEGFRSNKMNSWQVPSTCYRRNESVSHIISDFLWAQTCVNSRRNRTHVECYNYSKQRWRLSFP